MFLTYIYIIIIISLSSEQGGERRRGASSATSSLGTSSSLSSFSSFPAVPGTRYNTIIYVPVLAFACWQEDKKGQLDFTIGLVVREGLVQVFLPVNTLHLCIIFFCCSLIMLYVAFAMFVYAEANKKKRYRKNKGKSYYLVLLYMY